MGGPAANTGGFSQAMDFAPVPVGYMNCQDVGDIPDGVYNNQGEIQTSSTNFTQSGTGTAIKETGQFGGQCKCPVRHTVFVCMCSCVGVVSCAWSVVVGLALVLVYRLLVLQFPSRLFV